LPDLAERVDPDSRAGIAIYEATVSGGRCLVKEASPKVSARTLEDALAFVRELISSNRMQVRGDPERHALEKAAEVWTFGNTTTVSWDGDVASLGEPDERMQLMLAPSVFRVRFGGTWPSDADGDDDE
jgi:hypothetical protein